MLVTYTVDEFHRLTGREIKAFTMQPDTVSLAWTEGEKSVDMRVYDPDGRVLFSTYTADPVLFGFLESRDTAQPELRKDDEK